MSITYNKKAATIVPAEDIYARKSTLPGNDRQLSLTSRMRRNRSHDWTRRMVQENRLDVSDLIWPMFVIDGKDERQTIETMPGVERLSVNLIVQKAQEAHELGIPAIILFPATKPSLKTADGREALNPNNLICQTIRAVKDKVPEIGIITDVALDPYTDHGHDGLIGSNGEILNDETVHILAEQALTQSRAGADVIAPSDMMDGRVGAIRQALDSEGFLNTKIMAYTAKYASAFYGPFRDAVNTKDILKGDKKTYQMNPANGVEAIQEAILDIEEGADMLMVKPGMPYLDVIHRLKENFLLPVMAYQVSGEYAMLKAAGNAGMDYQTCMMEALLCFKRAGADSILTYAAPEVAKMLRAQ